MNLFSLRSLRLCGESDRRGIAIIALALAAAAPAPAQTGAQIPAHPDEIKFPEAQFEPPDAEDHRHALSGGITVFLAPGDELPLINVAFSFKGGSFLDPPERIGLAEATGDMIRRGGTMTMSPAETDETLDFLAAEVSTSCGETQSVATLNCLTDTFDESFALFIDLLRNPGFDAARLTIYRQEAIEAMKQRNDQPGSILGREWQALMYGRDHFEAAVPTLASLEGITEGDLRAMHRRIFHSGNLVIAINGDFKVGEMIAKLERALAGWEAGAAAGDPPAPTATPQPGVHHIEKDIPQGRVRIGLRTIARDDPDYFPMLLMNDILGGGGFTSRITQRVRSDEGLAYSARSRFEPRVWYGGELNAGFESKNRTVALATKIVLEEFDRIRTGTVSEEELDTAQRAIIERFPRNFESKAAMLAIFVNDRLTGRDPAYWRTYRDKVRGVTAQHILEVAQRRLTPDQLSVLVVGKWDEIEAGDLEGRADMHEILGGTVTHVPLRDPLTQEPME